MKDILLVGSYFYTHISYLLGFDINDMVSFNIKYFFFLEIFIIWNAKGTCKDQVRLGSRIRMDLSPNDTNNKFIECGRES